MNIWYHVVKLREGNKNPNTHTQTQHFKYQGGNIMSFENASITWGAKQLAAMVKNERIVFTNLVQRGLVWERARKSG